MIAVSIDENDDLGDGLCMADHDEANSWYEDHVADQKEQVEQLARQVATLPTPQPSSP